MAEKVITLMYNVPIEESAQVDNDFIIQGVAINATTTSNNHKFLTDELRTSANSLKGVPLLVDHRNEVSAIKGRVLIGEYDEMNSRINFKAKVVDSEVKKLIKDGLINSVSVGAAVREIEESDDGVLIPRGISFKELSLVAVPADGGATFTTAMHEAYKMTKEWDPKPAEPEKVVEPLEEKPKVCPECKKPMKDCECEDEVEDKAEPIEAKSESQDTTQSMKGGIKMSEETTKVEQKAVISESEKLLKDMMESMKAMREELSALKAQKVEVKESDVEEAETKVGQYKIVQGFGGLRGNSYTLVR
jgi:membrane-associated HD superfamily phosphohydrolase